MKNIEENSIKVKDDFRGAHPMIRELRKHFKTAHNEYRMPRLFRPWKTVPIDVGKELVNRALRIGDTLIKALKKRGYWTEEYPYHVTIKKQEIEFAIEEPYKIKKAPKDSIYEQEYYGSGILRLRIINHSRWCRYCFTDRENKKVEDCLSEFIRALEENANKRIEDELERQRIHEEWELKEKIKQKAYDDALAVFTKEELKVSKLFKDTKKWNKSKILREYIEAVKKDAIANNQLDKEKEEWITWAYQQADRLDPLKESPHSVLDEPRPEKISYW